VDYGISLKKAKSEKADSVSGDLRTPGSPIEIRETREPLTPADQVDVEDADPHDEYEYTPSDSDPDDIVHIARPDGQEGQDGEDSGLADPFYAALFVANEETPLASPNPRKRNAKAASLPDSVTDSERSYGGSKHKAVTADSNKRTDSSTSKHAKKPSLIPRPVSSLGQFPREGTNITLPKPMDYKSTLEEGYRRWEASIAPAVGQDNDTGGGILEELGRSNAPSPETPKASLGRAEDTGESKLVQDCESVSMDASQGSPPDMAMFSASPKSRSALNNESSGGEPVQQRDVSPCPSSSGWSHSPITGPQLILTDGAFHIQSPYDLQPAAYEISITLLLPLQTGRPRGWWELVVPGLPRLARNEHGYVYFRTPAGQGMEFRTTHFKRYNLMESCLMAQFLIPSKLVIPLRPCESRFYGFLKDFKVTQAIRAEVVADKDEDSQSHIVKYRAVCSIDLIQRDFWAESCGFCIWINGGPEGEFLCQLPEPRQGFETIHLRASVPGLVGNSKVQIICNPTHLGMFVLAWEVKAPRARSAMWMPRIRAGQDKADIGEGLQAEFEDAELDDAEFKDAEPLETPDVVRADPMNGNELRNKRRRGTPYWKRALQIWLGLFLFFILVRLADRVHKKWCVCPVAEVEAEPVPEREGEHLSETPVEEPIREEPIMKDPIMEEPVLQVIFPTSVPLRDRIDYFLGWRGPIPNA